ncbi:hypothetical protein [Paraglaciecola sp. L1A13]|nr:hypothetical protein [Paraglaciecola sp. L1A13]
MTAQTANSANSANNGTLSPDKNHYNAAQASLMFTQLGTYETDILNANK